MTERFQNPHRVVATVLWSIVGTLGVLTAGALSTGEKKYWLGCVIITGLLLLPALICQFIMIPRVERQLDKLRRGEYLVHWTYRDAEWKQWRTTSESKWEERMPEQPSDAYISTEGVYFIGPYHSWTLSFNYWLETVELKRGSPDWLEVTYAWSSGQYRPSRMLRVPVPENKLDEARTVVDRLEGLSRGTV